jgi:hypothetical protein
VDDAEFAAQECPYDLGAAFLAPLLALDLCAPLGTQVK